MHSLQDRDGMDWIADDQLESLGLLLGEAVELLVDSHAAEFDKRAAMLQVQTPTLTQNAGETAIVSGVRFEFQVQGNRQRVQSALIEITPAVDGDDAGAPVSGLVATCSCGCVAFHRDNRCPHTLAASWWLQEQIARRRGNGELIEFLGGLKADALAAGRQFVDELLRRSKQARSAKATAEPSRLQWRIRVSPGASGSEISITPFEQKLRKGGKGWTKGREVRSFDLLDQKMLDNHVDARVASLTSIPTHGVIDDHYGVFEALRMLAGHERIAWDDSSATPIDLYASQLSLRLEPVEIESNAKPAAPPPRSQSSSADTVSPDHADSSPLAVADPLTDAPPDAEAIEVRFQPKLSVDGIDVDAHECDVVFGNASPIDPMIVLADSGMDRVIVCTLPDQQAVELVQFLLHSDYRDMLLDETAATKLALSAGRIDSLVHVELPPQLAGPILTADTEQVLQLRPRPGAGLRIALRIHESRFRDDPVPGQPPELIPCLSEAGPVRLRRDLELESAMAQQTIDRFELDRLSGDGTLQWVAESDHAALDFLGRLHAAGEQAPRLVWPEGETFRVRGEITPKSLRVKIDDSPDWFGLSGTVTIDGVAVPLQDLLTAVRDDRDLVRVGDRRFAKISDSFRKRLTQLGDTLVAEKGQLRLAGAAVPIARELLGDDVELEATAAWHQAIERLDALAQWNPDRPDGLDAQLRDYQLDGYRWLSRLSRWGVGGVLADDMGLGKTVQTLGALVDRASDGPALVVAPTSVGDNWVREAERFAPSLRPLLYRDQNRDAVVRDAGPGDVLIVSYQLLQRDAKRFATRQWHTLVLDEAQFIKNSQTKTSQAIRTLQADWRLGLSGTPLENHLGELWSLFRTLSPGLLGSWQRFRSRFAEPIERHNDADRREALARLVRPFVLRRTKQNVLKELPPRTEITLRAELTEAERTLYEDARLAALAELSTDPAVAGTDRPNEGRRRIQTLAWLTRLRQLACHPALVEATWKGTSAKLQLLLSLVDELRDGGHRALVFSQFVKHLTVVRQALDERGISYQYLDGATPSPERQRRVDAFQDGDGDLFLISLKAGGTGLNLTAADYVLHLDPWWNPAVEDQATDRAHRIGQERAVTVYRLVAEKTIEEQILQLHADKRELVAGVLDGTDAAGLLGTQDLIELIKAELV
ncbi:MAG: DEAD/DEAH box helicase [Planctomycetota bacterium]